MKRVLIFSLLLFTGCAVRAGNPGDGTNKVRLIGVVSGLEDQRGIQVKISVLDTEGHEQLSTVSDIDGSYDLSGLSAGKLTLQAGESYRRQITIPAETTYVIYDIVLPVPAAPTRFRSVRMGPQVFCLLWDDQSGLEKGYRVIGPQGVTVPTNTIGIIHYFPNVSTDSFGLYQWPDMNLAWSEKFAGTYFVAAFNEYGNSISTATQVNAYGSSDWSGQDAYDFDPSKPDISSCGGVQGPPNDAEQLIYVREQP